MNPGYRVKPRETHQLSEKNVGTTGCCFAQLSTWIHRHISTRLDCKDNSKKKKQQKETKCNDLKI